MTWALLWHSKNKLDGISEHIINEDCLPKLFHTRKEARDYAHKHYGYIMTRLDLREEPHGWRMPKAVKVKIILTYAAQGKEK